VSVVRRDIFVFQEGDLLCVEVPHDTLEAVEDSFSDQEEVIDVIVAIATRCIDKYDGDIYKAASRCGLHKVEEVEGNIVLINIDGVLREFYCLVCLVIVLGLIEDLNDGIVNCFAVVRGEK
jgi:hypothetical protein